MAQQYDVTILTVRPGTHPQALAVLGRSLPGDAFLLACWYSDIGTVNQILLIRTMADPAAALDARLAALKEKNPFGIGEFITAMAMDTYVSFDFIPAMRPGEFGPCYEVRTYELKPDGLTPTRPHRSNRHDQRRQRAQILLVVCIPQGTCSTKRLL